MSRLRRLATQAKRSRKRSSYVRWPPDELKLKGFHSKKIEKVMITIVLLPGMDGTGSMFDPFVATLGNYFNIIIVRYPTSGSLGYKELEEIARLSLPNNGDFIILGESFSGPIAVSLASTHPRGLVGLVLCSTFIRNPKPVFNAFSWLVDFLPVKLAPHFVHSHFLIGRWATKSLESAMKTAINQVSSAAFRARISAVLSVDVSTPMSLVSVPTLYLQASQDRLVPRSAAAEIANIYPETEIVSFDAPHFLLQVAANDATAAVIRFADKIRT